MFSWNPFSMWRKEAESAGSTDIAAKNSSYDVFSKLNNDIVRAVSAKSVINQSIAQQQSAPSLANPVWQSFMDDSGLLAMPMATNKAERIAQYRTMAKHT